MENDILLIKKEDSIFAKGQRAYLVFPNEYLVPGEISEDEDFFEIALDTEGLTPAASLAKGQGPDRYRFLIACAKLEKLRRAYSFSLDPENIMYDTSFIPKLRLRDGAGYGDEDFTGDYKALIAATLSPGHSFSDYRQGGEGLYQKDKQLSEIGSATETGEIEALLKKALSELERKLATDSRLISKRKYLRMQILFIAFACLFGICTAITLRFNYIDLPGKDSTIEISYNYLYRNYIAVLLSVSERDIDTLSQEERYMAAYSGAITSNLNDKQRTAVMQAITLQTDSLYLDFWINMGLGRYEDAIDISRRLGDVELELYSLVIHREAVSRTMDISGAEKAEKLKSLDGQIDALEKAILDKAALSTAAAEELAAAEAAAAALAAEEQKAVEEREAVNEPIE